jgi:hypothetical protein
LSLCCFVLTHSIQLNFWLFLSSFAQIPDISEVVFLIRNQMHSTQTCHGGPSDKVFRSIQDFAGEIVCRRQLDRNRKHAQNERIRAAEGVAAHAERRAALEYAEQLNQQACLLPISGLASFI